MASAAKKRRQEQEDTLVQKTVDAVLQALEKKGVIPADGNTGANSNGQKTPEMLSQESTLVPSTVQTSTNMTLPQTVVTSTIQTHTTMSVPQTVVSPVVKTVASTTGPNTAGPSYVITDKTLTPLVPVVSQSNRTAETVTNSIQEVLLGTSPEVPIPEGCHATDPLECNGELGFLIPQKLKESIWKKEFIELHELLRPEAEEFTLRVTSGGQMSWAPKKSIKTLSINQWTQAFTIYMDIYIQKYPLEASGMLAYMSTIRDLERAYGGVVYNYYDRNFRARKERQNFPWGLIHDKLWIKATTIIAKSESLVSNNTNTQGKYCFDFNKINGCFLKNCKYPHVCKHCRKSHPGFKCFLKQGNSQHRNRAAPPFAPVQKTATITQQSDTFRPHTSKK